MKSIILRRPFSILPLFCAVCLIFGGAAHAQIAGVKRTFQIFDRSTPPRLEFNAVAETLGPSDNGYMPVRVEVTPVAKITADREFRIRIETHPLHRTDVRDELVWDTLSIPEGTTGPIEKTVLVPMRGEGKTLELALSEDDATLYGGETAFSDQVGAMNARAARRQQFLPPNTPPQIELNTLSIVGSTPSGDGLQLDQLPSPAYSVKLLKLSYDQIDRNWLGLSGFDVISISYEHLQEFAQKQPERWEALTAAVHAGATLMVFDCGNSLVNPIAEIDEKFGIASEKRDPAWRLPDSAKNTDSTVPRRGTWWYRENISFEKGPFAYRRLGFGSVVSISQDEKEVSQNLVLLFSWIRRELTDDRLQWEQRIGLSHEAMNGEFWNFLIPGVGEVPILGFVIVITFFMVLIGPVNYLLLLRFKRLAWMLFTIPSAATLFTLGLFAYAALSDGFSSRVRLRSYTELDQRAGRYASVSRQNYFTAFPPSNGLVFPAQTAVYPLHFQPYNAGEKRGTYGGTTSWEGKEQRLTQRYLLSRSQTQFVTQRSGTTDAKLEFKIVDGRPQVHNLLGVDVVYLLYRDEQAQLHQMENISAGATVILDQAAIELVSRRWSQYVGADPLVTSDRWQRIAQDLMRDSQRYMGAGNYTVRQSTGLLESGIRDLTKILAADTAIDERSRSFAAILAEPIVDRNEETSVPVGIPQVQRVREFHAIRGRVGP